MTLRYAPLTAVAALAVAMAGGASAQDAATAPGTTAPAGSSYATGTPPAAAETQTPAPEASAQEAPAPEAPAAEVPAADTPAAPAPEPETPAEAPAAPAGEPPATEAPATETPAPAEPAPDAAASEAAAEAEPAAEPAATEPAAEPAAEEPAADQPATETAVETPAPAAEAAADTPVEAGAEPPAEPAAAGEAAGGHDDVEGEAAASHAAPHIEDISFSFEGPFGKFDQFQLQRGLQVFTEVCSACHGLRYVPLRTLADPGGPGLPEDQVRAYAANLSIMDTETEEERPRTPTDHFPTVSGEGMGPDLSLMAKARAGFHGPYGFGISQLFRGTGGPEYIHAILAGYNGETKEEAGSTFYHNAAFSTGWIQMPQPLSDGQVTYEDGTEATIDQMARDVSAFLMWTAEPKMMDRKQVGLISVMFLIVLASLLYLTNKKLWWSVKHGRKPD